MRRLCAIVALSMSTASFAAPAMAAPPGAMQGAERGLVRGVIFDPVGRPVAGARVRANGVEVHTSVDGGFVVELPPGRWDFEVEAPGFVGGRIEGVEVGAKGSVEVVATLWERGRIRTDIEGAGLPKAAAEAPQEAGPPGRVMGTLRVLDKGRPVKGARVFVRGSRVEGRSGADGRFELELPEGTYDLSIVHPEYTAHTEAGVEVAPESEVRLEVELAPASFEVEPFVIYLPELDGSTAALLEERQKSSTMNEVLGAEQFSKSGDSSAASALKRVTGLTIVGGKFVYIRGLGGRYSQTLLNGSTLPSTEPDKRAVPLDMFPSALLESITIQKTYSAPMPGEFGGGVVQLKTRKFPREFKASVSLGAGYVHGVTGREVAHYQGGSLDWLGVDDGTRRLPGDIRAASQESVLQAGGVHSAQDIERYGEGMPANWGLDQIRLLPNLSVGANVGGGFRLWGRQAGVRAALTYSNQWGFNRLRQQRFNTDSAGNLTEPESREFELLGNNILLSLMVTGGIELGEESGITLTSILTRVTDNETTLYSGLSQEERASLRGSRGRWQERQLLIEQVVGRHQELGLDWSYTFSMANMSEPDRRDVQQLFDGGEFRLSNRADGQSTFFSELVDQNHDLSLNWERAWFEGATWRFGPQLVFKRREVDTRRYKYQGVQALSDEVRARPVEEIFVPSYIADDALFLNETTRGTDNYDAFQLLGAGYGTLDWEVTSAFTLELGARAEYSHQYVRTFNPNSEFAPPIEATLPHLDVFPSVNATYKLSDTMQLRAAAGRTASRPNFRELSPAQFSPPGGGIQTEGNPELEPATITHADARWEWYPGSGESVSVGGFFKHFANPIEPTYLPGATTRQTFINVDDGLNVGVEVEARRSLKGWSPWLRDVWVSANAAWVYSRVEITDPMTILTSKERPLVGQSPYVLNAQLEYDNQDAGLGATLLFNYVGPRIDTLGSENLPDTYEAPRPQLDLVIRKKWGKLTLGLSAKNLLDQPLRLTQGTRVFQEFDAQGRAFSGSLGWAW